LASTGLVVASTFLLCSEDFTAALVSAGLFSTGLTYYVETGAVLAGFFSSLANSFLTSFGYSFFLSVGLFAKSCRNLSMSASLFNSFYETLATTFNRFFLAFSSAATFSSSYFFNYFC